MQHFTREGTFGAADKQLRTAPLTLSTEHPVDRGNYVEILDHAVGSIDLSRAPLPLIESHDQSRLNIGVVDQLQIEGGKLRGRAVFGKSQRAQEVYADVEAGIVRNVSIGYHVNDGVPEGSDARTFRFKFQPIEVSMVSVPADPHAGFYRHQDKDASMTTEVFTQDNVSRHDAQSRQAQENERIRTIAELGKQYERYVNQRDVADAIGAGHSKDTFLQLIVDRQQTGYSDTRQGGFGGDVVDGAARERSRVMGRYNLCRAIAAQINPSQYNAGLEMEMSREQARQWGQSPQGFYVPVEYFARDFTVTGTAGAANMLPVDVYGDVAMALRPASAVIQAGVRVFSGLSGDFLLPRVQTGATAGMLSEVGTAAESDVVTTSVRLTPKRVGVYTEASKQSIIQSAIATESLIRGDLVAGAGALIDAQCLNGSGSGTEMRGLRNTSGIGTSTAGANGATIAWSHFVDLEAACANANAITAERAGYLLNSKTVAKAKTVQKGTNLAFILDAADNRVNGSPWYVANNLPSNLTKGTATTVCSAAVFSADWSMAALAFFGGLDVTVDPYSKAEQGLVRIVLNQFVDFGVRQPAAFAKIEDLLT